MFYFCSGLRVGVREFCRRIAPVKFKLAAVVGRLVLPTQSSVSRCLACVEFAQIRPFCAWLLLVASGARDILRHPASMTRDVQGGTWSVFDFDPTMTGVRKRALPEGEELPPGRRRAKEVKPGHQGRKRGEVHFRRCALQHAGTGLWLHAELHPGNTGTFQAWNRALERIVETCRHASIAREQTFVRADGECGYAPYLHAAQQAGVHYISRSSAYQLLDDPGVARHLATAQWVEVPSSGSGPRRYATDLGQVTLTTSRGTERAHGVSYPPVSTRMVVSRFEAKEKRGTGSVRDGWQYELYVTDLPPDSWPAAELVWAYYGRIGQENRFAQEDRELQLDRTFSHHLAGQELAVNIGLWIWNLQICHGFALAKPEPEVAPQTLREAKSLQLPPMSSIEAEPDRPEPSVADDAKLEVIPAAVRAEVARQALIDELRGVDWPGLFEKLGPDWSRHDNGLDLVCPNGATLDLQGVSNSGKRSYICFRGKIRHCANCPLLPNCTRTATPDFRKSVVGPRLSAEHALAVKRSLRSYKRALDDQRLEEVRRSKLPQLTPAPRRTAPSWQPADGFRDPSTFAPCSPLLLPANLRKTFTRACEELDVEITAKLWARRHPKPILKPVASSEAERQHRRSTWKQRDQWNALPTHAAVRIVIQAQRPLGKLLLKGEFSRESRAG